MDKRTMQIEDLKVKLAEMVVEIDRMRKLNRDCVNELCYRCGEYQREHLGACDGCRWMEVRHATYRSAR